MAATAPAAEGCEGPPPTTLRTELPPRTHVLRSAFLRSFAAPRHGRRRLQAPLRLRAIDVVDDEHLERRHSLLELQSKLLGQGGKHRADAEWRQQYSDRGMSMADG